MEQSYPVEVRARLDEPLSRWLWLVKWLLAMPHYIVLFFLWIAFAVVTVIAFFAIVFTGRSPGRCSASTWGCCAGRGGSATTPIAPWGPTATRRSASGRSRTTPPRWTSPTRSGSPAAWSWSSGGCWPCRVRHRRGVRRRRRLHRHRRLAAGMAGRCPLRRPDRAARVLRGDHAAGCGPLPARAVRRRSA